MNDIIVSTRRSYDHIASEYAEHIYDELQGKPFDCALLDRFAGMVKPRGIAADMGCGPGQIARYLHERGVQVIGIDLSPRMIETARALNPGIDFQTGNMLALETIPDNAWGGIAAFYSIIHIPRAQIVDALCEFQRVLAPGGILFLAFHRGDGTLVETEIWGKEIYLEYTLLARSPLEQFLRDAGFEILDVVERAPYAPEVEYQSHRVYLFAQKPE